jgi:hypothetical protein
MVNETSYFIDSQGYLLDSSLVYLLDKNNSKIKLLEKHLEVLKKEGLIGPSKEIYKTISIDSVSTNSNDK